MFKSKAGSLRTPRRVAEEKGTDARGFEGGVEYCSNCGHPAGGDIPHGHYDDKVADGRVTSSKPNDQIKRPF